ncbi:Fe-S cluster assembly protein SufD [Salinibacterium sp. SYSU T00001]|uniref:Fe-S cluster assembly protein SufD n=1 Tax=Homoserinimonas sedimenticola TaxID=2986805 RepID=UPI00223546D2|nr:Fe-S cluster assembly protein SufD [Salinibacterium sedimenticola]MCW4384410.1 Fe-S cluster assembly protein SufD [Salinibacterium sedimenticola]
MSVPVTSAKPRTEAPLDHSKIGSAQHSAGGLGLSPVQTRSERFAAYEVERFQPARPTDAEWKYTPLAKVEPLTAGELDGGSYEYESQVQGGASVSWIARDDARIGTAGTPEDRASANAWSSFERALAIEIEGEDAAATVARRAMGGTARAAHLVIEAAPNSRGVVVLENTGGALLAENLEIIVGDAAELTVISLHEWEDDAIHLASHFTSIGRQGHLKHVSVTLGGDVVRVNPTARLGAERGEVELYGLYFADAGQHIEHQVFVNHDAPHTTSTVTYKGALQGDGAHTVWIGDVLIGRNGTGTESYEQNRNLLLSDGARADSVPNLEIETGDIVGAGHASASGRFDDEQLFYLQARGIPEDEARRLVVRGFLGEVVQKIGVPEIEERLDAAIEAELAVTP